MKLSSKLRATIARATWFCSVLLVTATAHADVKLPAIFSDHLVLQATESVPLWGWAEPGEKI